MLNLGLDPSTDDLAQGDVDGLLEADLAEPSLSQRLAATDPSVGDGLPGASSSELDLDAPSDAVAPGAAAPGKRTRPHPAAHVHAHPAAQGARG